MKQRHTSAIKKTWWGPVWRGLVVDSKATHYHAMKGAFWLFAYLIIHADRHRGNLVRKYQTIADDMCIPNRTIRRWLTTLRRQQYIAIKKSGTNLVIHIKKWKPITAPNYLAKCGQRLGQKR
jgi:hypothetical protein